MSFSVSRTPKQTVAYYGREPVLDALMSEVSDKMREVVQYDHTDKVKAAIAFEQELVERGYVSKPNSPGFGAGPTSFDLTVTGIGGVLDIKAAKEQRRVPVPRFDSMQQFDMYLAHVLQAMRAMLMRAKMAAG